MRQRPHPGSAIMLVAAVSALAAMAAQPSLATNMRAATASPVIIVTAGKPTEYDFTLSRSSVKRGAVIFKFTNRGKLPHGFAINGKATKIIKSHATTTLTVSFKKAGRYIYQCSEPHVDPNQENLDQVGDAGPCGGGVLKVT